MGRASSHHKILGLVLLVVGNMTIPMAAASFAIHHHHHERYKWSRKVANTHLPWAHRQVDNNNKNSDRISDRRRHHLRDPYRRFVSAPLGILTGLTTSATVAAAFMPSFLPLDPLLTTEILNDMSHLTLDVASFLRNGLLGVRIAAIAGRLCTIAADFLPDHSIFPEEIIFQTFMLMVAIVGLARAAVLPIFAALHTNVQIRDGKTYDALFAPAGVSWTQFKAMSLFAMDWIELSEGETLTSIDDHHHHDDKDNYDDQSNFMYWLYSGNITVEHANHKVSYDIHRASGPKRSVDSGRTVIGEHRLLRDLHKKHVPQASESASSSSSFSIRANTPSTVLRVHATKLQILMENDSHLAESIRIWLYRSMEAKWNARLHNHHHHPVSSSHHQQQLVHAPNATVSF